jgi:hypothetical protein
MPEVFTIIFFVAWLHARKGASKVKALSSWFNPLIFSQKLSFFLHHNKMAINKKLPAGFLMATCFLLPEIYLEKGCDRLAIII